MINNICKFFAAAACCTALIMFGCGKDGASPTGSGDGVGGSMARFATVGQYLYAVDENSLKVFDLANPQQPQLVNTANLGFGIETIFPRDSATIFIGSRTDFFMYSIRNPRNPERVVQVRHFRANDPVVANNTHAFVTLRAGLNRGGVNELQVYDIADIANTSLLKRYPMAGPYGLGLKDSTLYVCDNDTLKVYNAADPLNLQKKKFYNIKSYDVIPLAKNILVIGSDGLYQYKDDKDSLSLLSRIPVSAN